MFVTSTETLFSVGPIHSTDRAEAYALWCTHGTRLGVASDPTGTEVAEALADMPRWGVSCDVRSALADLGAF